MPSLAPTRKDLDWIRIGDDKPPRYRAIAKGLTYEITERAHAAHHAGWFDITREEKFLVRVPMLFMAMDHVEIDAAHVRAA